MPTIVTPSPAETAAGLFEQRFKAAVADIRRAGVTIRQNVPSCCRGCLTPEQIGLTRDTEASTPHLWTFGGQNSAYTWIDGLPYERSILHQRIRSSGIRYRDVPRLRNRARVPVIYFYHGGPEGRAALVAADVFCAHEIEVVWDGTASQCLQVVTPFFEPARDGV